MSIDRDGNIFSQIAVQGYTYSVAETIDEIEALIKSATSTVPSTERKSP